MALTKRGNKKIKSKTSAYLYHLFISFLFRFHSCYVAVGYLPMQFNSSVGDCDHSIQDGLVDDSQSTGKQKRKIESSSASTSSNDHIYSPSNVFFAASRRPIKKPKKRIPCRLLRLEWGVENRDFVPPGEIKDLIRAFLTEIHGPEDATLLSSRGQFSDVNEWKKACCVAEEQCRTFIVNRQTVQNILTHAACITCTPEASMKLLAQLLSRFETEYPKLWIRHVKMSKREYMGTVSLKLSQRNAYPTVEQWIKDVRKCIEASNAPVLNEWISYCEGGWHALDADSIYVAMVEFGIVFDSRILMEHYFEAAMASEHYGRTLKTVLVDRIPISELCSIVVSFVLCKFAAAW